MSSTPFQLAVPVVDSFAYDSASGEAVAFIMRGKDEMDCLRKLDKVLDNVPETMEMLTYHIGYRPDKPIPVARYFVEARIEGKDRNGYALFWHGCWSGRKKDGT